MKDLDGFVRNFRKLKITVSRMCREKIKDPAFTKNRIRPKKLCLQKRQICILLPLVFNRPNKRKETNAGFRQKHPTFDEKDSYPKLLPSSLPLLRQTFIGRTGRFASVKSEGVSAAWISRAF